jgi:hypothetical protein
MTHCSSLGEVAAANVAEVRNMGDVEIVTEVVPTVGDDEMHAASDDEGHASTGGRTDNSTGEKASDDENSWAYNLWPLLLPLAALWKWQRRGILQKVKLEHLGQKPCQSQRKTKLSYIRTFCHHPTRASASCFGGLLLKFLTRLQQLTPNAIVQLSKYFWAVGIFRGVPSGDAFVKRYELHYQPMVETDGGVLFA